MSVHWTAVSDDPAFNTESKSLLNPSVYVFVDANEERTIFPYAFMTNVPDVYTVSVSRSVHVSPA